MQSLMFRTNTGHKSPQNEREKEEDLFTFFRLGVNNATGI